MEEERDETRERMNCVWEWENTSWCGAQDFVLVFAVISGIQLHHIFLVSTPNLLLDRRCVAFPPIFLHFCVQH